jgi:hypothetical protein
MKCRPCGNGFQPRYHRGKVPLPQAKFQLYWKKVTARRTFPLLSFPSLAKGVRGIFQSIFAKLYIKMSMIDGRLKNSL